MSNMTNIVINKLRIKKIQLKRNIFSVLVALRIGKKLFFTFYKSKLKQSKLKT